MSNVRKHARSSSESGSGSHARRAPGTSTPFPITAIKFEYPEQEQVAGTGGDEPLPLPLPCRVPMGSPTPTRPAMSARERYEFAHNLQRALTSLKPKPFTLNLTIKTPPSLVGRTRRNGSQSVPSPSFSSSDTINSVDSSKSYSTGFYPVHGYNRYALRANKSMATISSDRH